MKRFLDIVNENDEIIGQETRKKIHEAGLFHREVHVYFITPNREIIFQHRSKTKDTFPDLLDATVGGHVEIGDSYEQTAVKETAEEAGLKIKASDLIIINKHKIHSEDKISGTINNVFRLQCVYIYRGKIEDLKIETGEAMGFELWPLEKLSRLSDEDKAKFISNILRFATTELASFIKSLKIS